MIRPMFFVQALEETKLRFLESPRAAEHWVLSRDYLPQRNKDNFLKMYFSYITYLPSLTSPDTKTWQIRNTSFFLFLKNAKQREASS